MQRKKEGKNEKFDWENEEHDIQEVDVAYLKAVNLPSMFDVGMLPVNPTDSRLLLNLIDDVTYHKVVKSEVAQTKSKVKKTKIARLKSAL